MITYHVETPALHFSSNKLSFESIGVTGSVLNISDGFVKKSEGGAHF
jgi:hypothetical protein